MLLLEAIFTLMRGWNGLKTVVAIDSFKGSLTSLEAGIAAREGILRVYPEAEVTVLPIADGGEGTVQALTTGLHGTLKTVTVKDPLGRDIAACYGKIGNTAVIEIAAAAGIALLKKHELDPMNTTTYGVGQLIRDAYAQGCRTFIIGLGGSATNDGGVGMLQALGFEFLDEHRQPVSFGAKALENIRCISTDNVFSGLAECTFCVACDVVNPLCGENGCSAVFAPQKGATPDEVVFMDNAMRRYAAVVTKQFPFANPELAGAGAAGGLGFAFTAFLNGTLQSGIDLVLDAIDIENHLQTASLVLTGEGRIDNQTIMGKAPIGIAHRAKKHGKPVIAFAGCVTRDASVCNRHGIDAVFPIVRTATTVEEAMNPENAKQNMADCVEQVMRLWQLGHTKT